MRNKPDASLSDLERRAANTIRFGVIEETDYAAARVRVRSGDNVTGWIPWATARGGAGSTVWQPPAVGEQVVMASRDGDLTQAVVIGSVHSDVNPPPADAGTVTRTVYSDGSTVTFDAASGQMEATLTGGLTVTVGGVTLTIDANGLSVTGGTVRHNGKDIGDTHRHGGVQAGGSNTDVPV